MLLCNVNYLGCRQIVLDSQQNKVIIYLKKTFIKIIYWLAHSTDVANITFDNGHLIITPWMFDISDKCNTHVDIK